MIIRHELPKNKFTRIDRYVFTNMALSDGAVRLYGFLCGLRNGANFMDTYIVAAMGISQRVLTSRKAELKKAGLVLIEQITPRIYVIYIGHSKKLAAAVKKDWEKEEASISPAIDTISEISA